MIESNERLVLKQAEIITKLTNESRNKSKEIEDLYNKLDIVNLNAAYWKMLQAALSLKMKECIRRGGHL